MFYVSVEEIQIGEISQTLISAKTALPQKDGFVLIYLC